MHNLRGVVWTGTRWVAVGDVDSIVYLQGGRWISVPGLPNTGLRGVAARPGLIAASGSNGVVLTSDDGVSWTVADSGTKRLLWGGTRVGSSLLLGGQDSTILASTNGVTWAPVRTAPFPTGNPIAPRPLLWQLAAAGGRVVAVGDFGAILDGTVAAGLDGVRSPTDEILRGVAVAGGRWVAVGSGGTLLLSRDGTHWRSEPSPTAVDLRGVTWTGHRWVAVGDEGTVLVSADGSRWRVQQSAMPCALLGVARGSGRFVAVGGAGDVQLSRDGRRWQRIPRPTRQDLYSVAHGPRGFVAVGSKGAILTSTDGMRWTSRRSPTRLNLHAVSWIGSQYLAGGDRGVLLDSVDGLRWRRAAFPGFHSMRAFATDGTAVIAAGAGTIARRPARGSAWQLEPAGLGRFQTGVAYGDGRFVVVGHNGGVVVSTNRGAPWTPASSGVEVNLDTITWTGTQFVATGQGTAIVSPDGVNWRVVSLPTRRSLRSLTSFDGKVLAVGDGDTHLLLA